MYGKGFPIYGKGGGGRKEFINSTLSNTSIYHMSMFLIPKTNIKRLDIN
jgi:hypothetical protein